MRSAIIYGGPFCISSGKNVSQCPLSQKVDAEPSPVLIGSYKQISQLVRVNHIIILLQWYDVQCQRGMCKTATVCKVFFSVNIKLHMQIVTTIHRTVTLKKIK